MAHRNQKFRFSPEREKEREKAEKEREKVEKEREKEKERDKAEKQQYLQHQRDTQEYKSQQQLAHNAERERDSGGLSDSSKTISSQEEEKPAKEDREAKKTRVKQSLMKRARSVAIFSLKLKERRAREAELKAKEAEREARWQQPQSCVGGELSCIPIEKLISVDDIAAMELRRLNH